MCIYYAFFSNFLCLTFSFKPSSPINNCMKIFYGSAALGICCPTSLMYQNFLGGSCPPYPRPVRPYGNRYFGIERLYFKHHVSIILIEYVNKVRPNTRFHATQAQFQIQKHCKFATLLYQMLICCRYYASIIPF